jgi:hypothetical protein
MQRRRLEDRIREQCSRLITCENDEFKQLAVELRVSLSEHIERLRAKLVDYPAAIERRSYSSSIKS